MTKTKTKPAAISPATRKLARYIAAAIGRPLPSRVALRAKASLVDTFAAMVSGSMLLPGKSAISYAKMNGGRPEAGVIGSRLVVPATLAALANGMCAHADETDDTHPPSITHPGCSIVPAALAMAERQRRSGESLLRAIVLGYDVCARLMLSLNPTPFMRAGHNPCSFGQLFGSAASASALAGIDAQRIPFLLSFTAQQAGGMSTMLRDPQHIEKAFCMGGMPAQNGVAAALMVGHGFTGVDDVLSGERNFHLTYGRFGGDPDLLTRGLGRDYEILRGAIKRWPAGGPIQGPLHVARELMTVDGVTSRNLQRLTVRLPDKELDIVNNRAMPDISLQHVIALMLIDGTVDVGNAHDFKRVRDPRVRDVRKRIEVVGDPSLTDPERKWRAVIEAKLVDGRTVTRQTMMAKGSAGNPMTRAELDEKAMELIAPVMGAARARKLVAALWDVETLRDVRALRPLYQR